MYPLQLEHKARHNGLWTYIHPPAQKDAINIREYNPERMSTSSPGAVPASEPLFRDAVPVPCEVNKGYTLIRVYDTFTWSRDTSQDRETYIPHPLSALEVARELVSSWAANVVEGNGSMGPGVMVIEGDTPTADELTAVNARQRDYSRTLINSASTMFAKGDVKYISDLHRKLASWMGINNLPWVVKMEQVEMKSCRACGESIRSNALVCRECGTDLPKFYTEHGIVPDALEDPGVFAFMEKATAKPNKKAA